MQKYRARCSNCSYTSPVTVGGVSRLVLDEASNDSCADSEDRRLVLLHDEHAREILRRNQFGIFTATVAGRYLRVCEYFCHHCGHLYEQRTLASAFAQSKWITWTLTLILIAIPYGFIVFRASPSLIAGLLNGLFFGIIAAGATLALLDPIYCFWLRVRYPDRVQEYNTSRNCPHCGSKFKAIPGIYQGLLPCPACHKKRLKILPCDDREPESERRTRSEDNAGPEPTSDANSA